MPTATQGGQRMSEPLPRQEMSEPLPRLLARGVIDAQNQCTPELKPEPEPELEQGVLRVQPKGRRRANLIAWLDELGCSSLGPPLDELGALDPSDLCLLEEDEVDQLTAALKKLPKRKFMRALQGLCNIDQKAADDAAPVFEAIAAPEREPEPEPEPGPEPEPEPGPEPGPGPGPQLELEQQEPQLLTPLLTGAQTRGPVRPGKLAEAQASVALAAEAAEEAAAREHAMVAAENRKALELALAETHARAGSRAVWEAAAAIHESLVAPKSQIDREGERGPRNRHFKEVEELEPTQKSLEKQRKTQKKQKKKEIKFLQKAERAEQDRLDSEAWRKAVHSTGETDSKFEGPALAQPEPEHMSNASAPAWLMNTDGVETEKSQRMTHGTTKIRILQERALGNGKLCASAGSVVDFGTGTSWPRDRVAIVNAANTGGLDGGGVDEAINIAGGVQLTSDRERLPVISGMKHCRISTGSAVVTGPGSYGDLHGAFVVHAVGPDYSECAVVSSMGHKQLSSAYLRSMELAAEHGIQYLGFALLSTGVFRGNCSVRLLVQLAVAAVSDGWYQELEEVHLIGYSQEEQSELGRCLPAHKTVASIHDSTLSSQKMESLDADWKTELKKVQPNSPNKDGTTGMEVQYFMQMHKTEQCSIRGQHDHVSCPNWHSRKERRRNLSDHQYHSDLCNSFDAWSGMAGECPDGDQCRYAHNRSEQMFHPEKYRTMMCKRKGCRRPFCAFAHSKEEQRLPSSAVVQPSTADRPLKFWFPGAFDGLAQTAQSAQPEPEPDHDSNADEVGMLKEMGFGQRQCTLALEIAHTVESAAEFLIRGEIPAQDSFEPEPELRTRRDPPAIDSSSECSFEQFSSRMRALVGASKIPPHGWTATKMDTQYRQRFAVNDNWWQQGLQFGSASDAFKSIPDVLAVKKGAKIGAGTFFIPKESVVQKTCLAITWDVQIVMAYVTRVEAFLVAGEHTSATSAALISRLGERCPLPAELKGQKLAELLRLTDCSRRGFRIIPQPTTVKGGKGAMIWISRSADNQLAVFAQQEESAPRTIGTAVRGGVITGRHPICHYMHALGGCKIGADCLFAHSEAEHDSWKAALAAAQPPSSVPTAVQTSHSQPGPGYTCMYCGVRGGEQSSHWHQECPQQMQAAAVQQRVATERRTCAPSLVGGGNGGRVSAADVSADNQPVVFDGTISEASQEPEAERLGWVPKDSAPLSESQRYCCVICWNQCKPTVTEDVKTYKITICSRWSDTGTCSHGAKCDFAHGKDELREMPPQPPPRWKGKDSVTKYPLLGSGASIECPRCKKTLQAKEDVVLLGDESRSGEKWHTMGVVGTNQDGSPLQIGLKKLRPGDRLEIQHFPWVMLRDRSQYKLPALSPGQPATLCKDLNTRGAGCRRGDRCHFAHSNAELRHWSPGGTLGQAQQGESAPRMTGTAVRGGVINGRRPICRHIHSPGGCNFGADCLYAHSQAENDSWKAALAAAQPQLWSRLESQESQVDALGEEEREKEKAYGLAAEMKSKVYTDTMQQRLYVAEAKLKVQNSPAASLKHIQAEQLAETELKTELKTEQARAAAAEAEQARAEAELAELKAAANVALAMNEDFAKQIEMMRHDENSKAADLDYHSRELQAVEQKMQKLQVDAENMQKLRVDAETALMAEQARVAAAESQLANMQPATVDIPTWECEVDSVWQEYPDHIAVKLQEASDRNEKCSFERGNFVYDVNFGPARPGSSRWQVNQDTGARREIRLGAPKKRPKSFLDGVKIPADWAPMPAGKHCHLQRIEHGSPEWSNIEECMLKSYRTHHPGSSKPQLKQLDRIQNDPLWRSYELEKDKMKRELGSDPAERSVWHGTRGTDPKDIYSDKQDGFMMQRASEGMWGKGNYFAKEFAYSDRANGGYAHDNLNGTKTLLFVKLLVGKAVEMEPKRSLAYPPDRTDGSELRYNSVTGKTVNSQVYIVYENKRAYPEYLVQYSTRD